MCSRSRAGRLWHRRGEPGAFPHHADFRRRCRFAACPRRPDRRARQYGLRQPTWPTGTSARWARRCSSARDFTREDRQESHRPLAVINDALARRYFPSSAPTRSCSPARGYGHPGVPPSPRRTNEIGLRLALGATRRTVLWSVLRDCARLVTIGLCGPRGRGGPGDARLLSDLLFGVTTTDLRVFSVVGLFVAAVAAASAIRPAWRASRSIPGWR